MGADTKRELGVLFPSSVQAFPADLTAVVILVVLTALAVLLPGVRETPIRVLLGIPFVLFVPGYALVAALFPEAESSSDVDGSADEPTESSEKGGLDGLERVALSFGTSIAVVPLIGLILNFSPWGIQLEPILLSVGGFTFVAAYVGAQRRAALDANDRFRVPYERWVAEMRAELFGPESRTDLLLNVVMVVSVLLAVGTVGYAVAFPKQGESFTEFYLLTENETGALVADGYPNDFAAGEPKSLVVGVDNQEHERVSYTVVAALQRVQVQNNSTTVLETERLQQYSPTLDDNESWQRPHRISPTMTGDRLRLTYLLYRGEAPSNLTTENAYRELHLWVNVTEPQNRLNGYPVRPEMSAG